jgi:hypothetical protein
MASFSSVKPLSAAQLWDLLASNRVVVWGQRRSELEKQCLLTTRVRLDCDLDLVWGQDWFWSNLNFKRVSSVSVLSLSGVVFSLKRRIALFHWRVLYGIISPIYTNVMYCFVTGYIQCTNQNKTWKFVKVTFISQICPCSLQRVRCEC